MKTFTTKDKRIKFLITDKDMMLKFLSNTYYYGLINNKTSIISYYCNSQEKIDFSKCSANVLQIELDDIRCVDDIDNFYNQYLETFKSIALFIKEALLKSETIICQCNAGVSRSAATLKAIKEYVDNTGYEIDKDGSYIPNDLFYNCILKALKQFNN